MVSAPPARAMGAPLIVGANGVRRPEPIARSAAGGFVEDDLQKLIFDHPELLPLADIEADFVNPIALGREIESGHGPIDNLYITPSGHLVVVEAKLWRNAEARRKVITQALDYVSSLSRMTYDELERAVLAQARGQQSLYAMVRHHGEAPPRRDPVPRHGCS